MESVLHIEPLVRNVPVPESIGHNEMIFYGSKLTDGENLGFNTSSVQMGAPLELGDEGQIPVSIPLVKTVQYTPDFSRDSGFLYAETTHLLSDRKYLIPFRTKMRSGYEYNKRFTHIPSLNLARRALVGSSDPVFDPRSEIIADILLHDESISGRQNKALEDWLLQELSPKLDDITINRLSFDVSDYQTTIGDYIDQIRATPYEFGQRHLQELMSTVGMSRDLHQSIPQSFFDPTPLSYPLMNAKISLTPNTFDFRSMGKIDLRQYDHIEYNPRHFQDVCDMFDRCYLTDFNIDIVVGEENEVRYYHEHLAINRFQQLPGIELSEEEMFYGAQEFDIGSRNRYHNSDIQHYFTEEALRDILHRFREYHRTITAEIRDIIDYQPVKLKLIKTMADEAAVLLYRYNSLRDDPPLCGVYFDIALMSLAPMSVISLPSLN